jgi:hypothetical protein
VEVEDVPVLGLDIRIGVHQFICGAYRSERAGRSRDAITANMALHYSCTS